MNSPLFKFNLISNCSRNDSPMTIPTLDDSIDLYIDQGQRKIEIEIVKYLQALGVQTKTDPLIKEQLYWKNKRDETQKKMFSILGQTELSNTVPLETFASKLVSKLQTKKVTQSWPQSLKSQRNSCFSLDQQ